MYQMTFYCDEHCFSSAGLRVDHIARMVVGYENARVGCAARPTGSQG